MESSVLPEFLETAAPDQSVPGGGTLEDILSQLMSLGELQGRLEIQEWKEGLQQLRSLPKNLCRLKVSAQHLADRFGEHRLMAN